MRSWRNGGRTRRGSCWRRNSDVLMMTCEPRPSTFSWPCLTRGEISSVPIWPPSSQTTHVSSTLPFCRSRRPHPRPRPPPPSPPPEVCFWDAVYLLLGVSSYSLRDFLDLPSWYIHCFIPMMQTLLLSPSLPPSVAPSLPPSSSVVSSTSWRAPLPMSLPRFEEGRGASSTFSPAPSTPITPAQTW